jgi:vacuolar iron transporter family protein
MAGQSRSTSADVSRYRENYLVEMDGIALYRSLSKIERDADRAAIFERIARVEERHAQRWARLLQQAGAQLPKYRLSLRVRLLGWLARRFGTQRVLPIISAIESRDEPGYLNQPEAAGLPAEERAHSRALRAMEPAGPGRQTIARREGHMVVQGGGLRAAVFGVNDGLVSNFSLVMGFAGAEARPEYILLAGIAGLLAGSFSMAAGEYISMSSQREVFEQQIKMEEEELEMSPKEEEDELSLIYQAKGLPEREASLLARRIIGNPHTAIDTLAREELGLDPAQLGSPWIAAGSSFLAFVSGALLPVLPFMFTSGQPAWIGSVILSCLGLFATGAVISIFTARGPVISGLRMLAIGLSASAVTFGAGWLFGVSLSG